MASNLDSPLDFDTPRCMVCQEAVPLSDGVLCENCQVTHSDITKMIRRFSDHIEDLENRVNYIELHLALV